MSSAHTYGRLEAFTVYAHSELRHADGLVATVRQYSHNLARRLAVCWNACDGIATEKLEKVAGDPAPVFALLMETAGERDALQARVLELESRVQELQPDTGQTDLGISPIAHLPGPWFHIGQGDIICGQAPDTHDVATVYLREDGTTEANAALIAAAPDLLSALKYMLLDYGSISVDCSLVDQANAAITKATTINNR
jgi:hypothetical protein